MNDLVSMINGSAITTSKLIADKFKKQHRLILDAIKRVIKEEPEFGRANFYISSYTTEQQKVLECYDVTRDGYAMVAMALTGKEALKWKVKFINAFNQMEKSLLNVDARMNQLSNESKQIKQAGQQWSAMGHEISKAKKSNKKLCDELVKDVQGELSLEPFKTIITNTEALRVK